MVALQRGFPTGRLSVSDMSDMSEKRRERRLQVLYLGTVELLICGSCAVTAAAMYQRNGSKPDTSQNFHVAFSL